MTDLLLIQYPIDHDFDDDGRQDHGLFGNPSGMGAVPYMDADGWTFSTVGAWPGNYRYQPRITTFIGHRYDGSDQTWHLPEAKTKLGAYLKFALNRHSLAEWGIGDADTFDLSVTREKNVAYLVSRSGISVWRSGVGPPLRFNSRNDTLGVTAKHPRIQGKSASTTSASSQTGIRLKEHPSSYY